MGLFYRSLKKKKVKKDKEVKNVPLLKDVLKNLLNDLNLLKRNNYKRSSEIKKLIKDRVSELGVIRKNTSYSSKLFISLNRIIDPLITIEKYLRGEVLVSDKAVRTFVKDIERIALRMLGSQKL